MVSLSITQLHETHDFAAKTQAVTPYGVYTTYQLRFGPNGEGPLETHVTASRLEGCAKVGPAIQLWGHEEQVSGPPDRVWPDHTMVRLFPPVSIDQLNPGFATFVKSHRPSRLKEPSKAH